MSAVLTDPPTMTRGDLEPTLEVEVGDEEGVADFSTLSADDVTVRAQLGDNLVVDDKVDAIIPSVDGKTARVLRNWVAGETDLPGRMWITIVVAWPGGKPQHFPEDTPLLLNIRRAPGDG